MGFEIVVPQSVSGGFYKKVGRWSFGLAAHTLQFGQIWVFLIRYRRFIFGYRTKGDASLKQSTFYDSGFWFPWQSFGRKNVKRIWPTGRC